ncbi:hypothetical protein [Cellulomonas sp. PhB150]|uniref:hypothetical protein n=1 Tax=Cellulomonas sp. PhB150 TaxID=2485188 RepID=UPI0011CE254C|nr:hypothetical protein [Cellulomonas sp. PhB150]
MVLLVGGCTHDDPPPVDTAQPTAGSSSDAADPESSETAEVRVVDFQMTYQLDGKSVSSEAVGLLSDPNLELKDAPADGTSVDEGDMLGRLRASPEVLSALDTGSRRSRLDAQDAARLRSLARPLKSPVAGIFKQRGGQYVVANTGVDVVIQLSPIQELRYRSTPFEGRATIETVVGVRTVKCDAIWIDTTASTGGADDDGGGGHALHCRLPRQTETTAGLRAQLELKSVVIPEATVVPNITLSYDSGSDGYFVTLEDAEGRHEVAVDVGPTDGVVRVITSKLPAGAAILADQAASE